MSEQAGGKKQVPDLTGAVWRSPDVPGPAGGGRIEVAFVGDMTCPRAGEKPDSPVLVFTQAEWDAFVGGAKDGEFDQPMG